MIINPYVFTRPLVPGAAAVFSLRSVPGYLGGNVVRVRRDSDNAEQDFTATNLTDGTLAAFCGASHGYVRTWYDQSGNGRHAGQITQSRQPKIYDSVSGVITQNGCPAIQRDGVNDNFTIPSFALPSALTYVMVAEYVLPPSNEFSSQILIPKINNSNQIQEISFINRSGYKAISFNKNGISYATAFGIDSPHASGSQILLTFTYNGGTASDPSSYTLATNGTSRVLENGGDSGYASEVASIGLRDNQGLGPANNKIQELILYSTNQSANRTEIEAGINTYYAIY